MIVFRTMGLKAEHKVAHIVPSGQLAEDHTVHVVPIGKAFYVLVSLMGPGDMVEDSPGKEFGYMGEDTFSLVHEIF